MLRIVNTIEYSTNMRFFFYLVLAIFAFDKGKPAGKYMYKLSLILFYF